MADSVRFEKDDLARIVRNTGVRSRHISDGKLCTSDLCLAAAQRLLQDLKWDPHEVEGLVFLSQTPDYFLPATSCVLHDKLGLSTECAAFDINLGCSGYPYGLWVTALMVLSGMKKVLLLVGDTISRTVSPADRTVAYLFGDAGTATALVADLDAPPMHFVLGTDGSGRSHLMMPAGAFRQPRTAETVISSEREGGNIRSDEHLYMNGTEVFAFTLARVPPLVKEVLTAPGWHKEQVDAFVFHQANQFMLQHLARMLKIPAEKFVLALENYGNTSSASIPLAMNSTVALRERLVASRQRLVLAGFGVGLSWAAVAVEIGPIVMPEIVEVGEVVRV